MLFFPPGPPPKANEAVAVEALADPNLYLAVPKTALAVHEDPSHTSVRAKAVVV